MCPDIYVHIYIHTHTLYIYIYIYIIHMCIYIYMQDLSYRCRYCRCRYGGRTASHYHRLTFTTVIRTAEEVLLFNVSPPPHLFHSCSLFLFWLPGDGTRNASLARGYGMQLPRGYKWMREHHSTHAEVWKFWQVSVEWLYVTVCVTAWAGAARL
jgi:hypothetical protein